MPSTTRRRFLATTLATSAGALAPTLATPPLALPQRCLAADEPKRKPAAKVKNPICAFIKFVQSLPYDELAEKIADLGFDGIEATVRRGGHVLPERVEEDLPRLVEALRKHELDVTIMASDVNSVDQPHTEKVLRTAARLGIQRYRMGYYRYAQDRPVLDQLKDFARLLKPLVALNKQLGISAVYQNHAGARFCGAPVWDLLRLIELYPVNQIGVAFDIRHATVEGGLSWPVQFSAARSHLGAVYVKDFQWDGKQPKNVPLGEGRVDPRFFKLLAESGFTGPLSLHVEYLPKAGVPDNLAALARDLKTLRQLR